MSEEKEPKRHRPSGAGFLLFRKPDGTWLKDAKARKMKAPADGCWYACFSVNGKKVRESARRFGGSRQAAADLLLKRLGEGRSGTYAHGASRVTLAVLRDLVVSDHERNGRRTAPQVGRLFVHMERLIGERTPAEKIARAIPGYVAARLKEKRRTRRKKKDEKAEAKINTITRATVNRELAVLRRGFRIAVRTGLLTTMPVFEMLEEGPARKGFPEPKEIEDILTKLPERLRAPIRFLSIAGWRIREALKLEWRSVDFAAGTIRLESDETKGGEVRILPFAEHPELQRIIKERKAITDAWQVKHGQLVPWVFWFADKDERGRPIASPNRAYQHAWGKACRDSGHPGRLVHDLRRYAARNLVRAGVNESVAMKLLGHRTASVFRRYAIVDERDLRQALRNLADRSGSEPRSAERRSPRGAIA